MENNYVKLVQGPGNGNAQIKIHDVRGIHNHSGTLYQVVSGSLHVKLSPTKTGINQSQTFTDSRQQVGHVIFQLRCN